MKRAALAVGIMVALTLVAPGAASAGLLDKLNEAAKKANATTAQSKSSGQLGGSQVGGGGSLSAGLGATQFEALEKHQACTDSLTGLRAKITADKIERKMAEAKPSGDERQRWEEDLAAWRAAQKTGADQAASPDPKDPNRGLNRLTVAERTDINAEFGAKYNAVVSECQGRDHMNAGHTTKMNYVKDNSETQASAAKHEAAANSTQACLASVQGMRHRVTADILQKKLDALTKLSDQERTDWEADIASFRTAAEQNQIMPAAVDPANPTRGLQRLTMEDQVAINTEYAAASQALMAKCTAMAGDGKIEEHDYSKGGGLVDHSTSPANKQAKQQVRKAANGTGIGGSTNLEYMRRTAGCENPIKGHLAKVTADMLEAKLKKAGNLTPEQRSQWEADLASWRAAESAGLDQASPPDPSNPYRWQDYVTNQERQQINMQHASFTQQVMRECAKQDAGL